MNKIIPTPRKKTRRDGSEFFEIEIFMGRDANGKKHFPNLLVSGKFFTKQQQYRPKHQGSQGYPEEDNRK